VLPVIVSLLNRERLFAEIRTPTLRTSLHSDLDTAYPGAWTRLNIYPREAAGIIALLEDGPIEENRAPSARR